MEIKRFEALKGPWWKPGDKIVKGTLHWDFEIYKEDLDRYIKEYDDLESALQVYLQDNMSNRNFEYKLVDYQDNEIKDEEIFDDTNKYNL
jgi:hypothetical protein